MEARRRLPNFFIIGAARAATSSLYFYLSQHPDIFMCPDKEAQFFGFFDTERAHKAKYKTLDEYLELFSGAGNKKIVGEATPTYLAFAESAESIYRHCPDAKLLVSLRNPIDRAFSYYEMAQSKGHDRAKSFEAWIENNDFWLRHGGYFADLKRYFDLFGADRIMVVLFEDVVGAARETVASIHRFLGVAEIYPAAEPIAYNKGGHPTSALGALIYRATTNRRVNRLLKPIVPRTVVNAVHALRSRGVTRGSVDPATRQKLRDHFRDDILKTQQLIGRDLGVWLTD